MAQLESILDRYVLVTVDINPESRVKVEQGAAKPELVEAGTRLFLVKVINNGHVTAPLAVESPNSGRVYVQSSGSPAPAIKLTPKDSAERWADISLYQRAPMRKRSGSANTKPVSGRHSAHERMRLSSLTLPHALVRPLLAEALYRAWTVLKNHPYHRE